MSLTAAVGISLLLDSREAGVEAAQKVFTQLGRVPINLCIVIASYDHFIQQTLDGAAAVLGEVPFFGFSTQCELTGSGQQRRSVIISALSGPDLQTRSEWWLEQEKDPVRDETEVFAFAVHRCLSEFKPELLLLAGEGFNSSTGKRLAELGSILKQHEIVLQGAGCLAAGPASRGRTVQIGGQKAGSRGLSTAWIKGSLTIGVGTAHGWKNIGPFLRITDVQENCIQTLDSLPASDMYARLLGGQTRQWSLPPLNELVRLYPLGIEAPHPYSDEAFPVRSAFLVDNNGSLRMNALIPIGSTGHLMVGSASACLEAAKTAAEQALENLARNSNKARPVLALVLVDEAWRLMLEAQPGEEIRAIQSVLGEDLPIIGGYTYGQIILAEPLNSPKLLNQHIEIILFAEK
jgi:hypothetical protein